MAFEFNIGESAGDGIRRMAQEQIDKALGEIDDSGLDQHTTVHQVRKRCKKIRALLRLARADLDSSKIYKQENACFRDAALSLSGIRDAEALLETYDTLIDTFSKQSNRQRLKKVRDGLEERKREIADNDVDLDSRIATFARTMREARERVYNWPVGDSFNSLAPGLKANYRRGRKAMKTAAVKPNTENFHEWRKSVKYHLYHVQVLRPIWGAVLDSWRGEVKNLGEDLGDDHDLAVFEQTLLAEPRRFGSNRDRQALRALSDRRRAELQGRAFPAGQRIFHETPKQLTRRLEAYWDASRAEARLPADD